MQSSSIMRLSKSTTRRPKAFLRVTLTEHAPQEGHASKSVGEPQKTEKDHLA